MSPNFEIMLAKLSFADHLPKKFCTKWIRPISTSCSIITFLVAQCMNETTRIFRRLLKEVGKGYSIPWLAFLFGLVTPVQYDMKFGQVEFEKLNWKEHTNLWVCNT